MPESNSRRPIRYGPSGSIAGPSGITGREVRAFGHPRYNDPDSVSAKFVEVEEMNNENSNRDRENKINNAVCFIYEGVQQQKQIFCFHFTDLRNQ